ncbi:fumarylacetoacetate hydrolase family protein [Ornithinimicrobium murale]|uniref:fumarylacetoacetate hydrolase family protein n=1 Tax=Ornithinimicrobium murale TaxID=1050153 RepID=UPI00192DCBA9|nr:fumarylacetoacetate hydrolase family protein [Ornithinimicrobium murale]
MLDGTALRAMGTDSISNLLQLRVAEIRSLVESTTTSPAFDIGTVSLLPPVDGLTEVWASGVTYKRSRDARVEESVVQDVYDRVYGATRPELFFKSAAWRVVSDGSPVAIRIDSLLNVPEPELVLILNCHAEIVGYAVGNDMSSRSIEGENPLYLPQAKIYNGAFALSSGIRPAWELGGPAGLDRQLMIKMDVTRDGVGVWRGETTTGSFTRRFAELVEHLFRCYTLPDGALLSTGTGIVPGLDFTTLPGDVVSIEIPEVGTLMNCVTTAGGQTQSDGDLVPFANAKK